MTIAIVLRNLACLISKHNSLICKSPVSSSLSPHFPHFFSTRSERQNFICPRVYDLLLHKHHFSPEVAKLAVTGLGRTKNPENADSILSLLKESGCSIIQLEKIVKYRPRILLRSVEDIKFKIKIFQDMGLSPEDIDKLVSGNQMILHLSAKNNIIPTLSVLKGLLGSDYDVARLLRKAPTFVSADIEKTLLPNVELLKSLGIPMDRILFFLYTFPRFLLIKPDTMRKSIDKVKEMGFSQSSKTFIYAVRIIAFMSQGMWEAKLQSLRDTGFSDSDILAMFKRFPPMFYASTKKLEKIKQLLLDTGRFNMPSIVNNPGVFGCSIEKRLEPRLGILESKNLLKWPSLSTMYTLSEDKFFERYVRPYPDAVGKAFVTKSFVKEKK
ncbi:hypothetical protein ACS0TY_013426 [Phlomoides rotata]